MLTNEELEQNIVELLAEIYGAVKWSNFRSSKNPWEIFEHRVRASATRATVYQFITKLCNAFNISPLPATALEICDRVRSQEIQLLNLIYTEHSPLTMKAILLHKKRKGDKEEEKQIKKEKPKEEDNNLLWKS